MSGFGVNVSLRNPLAQIREIGEAFFGSGLFQALEITHYEHMEGVDTTAYNAALFDIVERYHPQISSHVCEYNLSEENQALRHAALQEIEHCMLYTRGMGGREIVIHSGYSFQGKHCPVYARDGGPGNRDDIIRRSWDLSVTMMQKICDIAANYQMTVLTENLSSDHFTCSGKDLARYVKDVGKDNLKVVFDVGHCNFTTHHIAEDIHDLGSLLQHTHIHDNHGERDEHLPLGEASLDIPLFLKALKDIGYQGVYMLEILNHYTIDTVIHSRNALAELLKKDIR